MSGPLRILVAEDETVVRLDVCASLRRAGHEVVAEARDGEEAVALAARHRPDLVVTDMRMPRMNGIEAIRRIMAKNPVPVVLLTAFFSPELVSDATEAGAYAYVVKPFRESDLLAALAVARARFGELGDVRAETAALADELASRKLIERAKGLLMAREGLTEAEAVGRLREASLRSRRPVTFIAEALLESMGAVARPRR